MAAQRYGGGRIAQVQLSERWYAEQLPPFKAAFEDGQITIPRDADVLDDLRALHVGDGVPRLKKARTIGHDRHGRHGDAAIALALAFFASRMDSHAIEYQSLGQERAAFDAWSDDSPSALGWLDTGGSPP